MTCGLSVGYIFQSFPPSMSFNNDMATKMQKDFKETINTEKQVIIIRIVKMWWRMTTRIFSVPLCVDVMPNGNTKITIWWNAWIIAIVFSYFGLTTYSMAIWFLPNCVGTIKPKRGFVLHFQLWKQKFNIGPYMNTNMILFLSKSRLHWTQTVFE